MKKGLRFITILSAMMLTGCDLFLEQPTEIENITLSPSSITLDLGDNTQKLTTYARGSNTTHSYSEIGYYSEDPSVVRVGTKGELFPQSVGSTSVYAKAKYFTKVESNKVTVIVSSEEPYIELNYSSYSLTVGSSIRIIGSIKNYHGSTTPSITYSSSKSTYLSVDANSGDATALKAGNATVIATCNELDIMATCSITMVESGVDPVDPVDPITLNKTDLTYNYKDLMVNDAFGSDSAPTIGDANILVVPIWFNNDSTNYISSSKKESVRNDIIKAFSGTKEDTGWYSVKTYYETESNGKLNYNVTVADWYNTSKRLSNYTSDTDYCERTTALIEDAANSYFATSGSKTRTQFDGDNNGHLDTVIAIYGAADYGEKNYGDEEIYSNLWAYTYWTTNNPNKINPTMNCFIWESYDFMYGDSYAYNKTGFSYAGGNNHYKIDAHTYIHEMGHAFGLDDYYDYGDNKQCPAGGFSMQDENVGGHDPFSVMAYGWASPYIPQSSCTITINDFQSSHDLILLTPNWNSKNSPFDEYLLLELYSPTGLNRADALTQYNACAKGPNEVGIRVWHVDARLIGFSGPGDNDTIQTLFVNPDNPQATYGVLTAFSNTFSSESGYAGYSYTYLNGSYNKKYSYNNSLLTLIRNSTTETYSTKNSISSSSLFKQGSSFTMSQFKKQFYSQGNNDGTLDSGLSLGWSFTVNSISDGLNTNTYKATITLTKS